MTGGGPRSQPASFSLPLPENPGGGPFTFTRDGGEHPGRVVFDVQLLSRPDRVEIWKGGVRVAATGQPTASGGQEVGPAAPATLAQTLAFDYTPSGSRDIEFRFNEDTVGSGWNLTGLRIDYPASGGSSSGDHVDVVSSPDGHRLRLEKRSMLSGALGLDGLVAETVATALSRIDAAFTTVSQAGAYFGERQKECEDQRRFASRKLDTLAGSLGDLLDADLPREAARLEALQVRERLAISALKIAGRQPAVLLGLFRSE